jgi:hypothetical protein
MKDLTPVSPQENRSKEVEMTLTISYRAATALVFLALAAQAAGQNGNKLLYNTNYTVPSDRTFLLYGVAINGTFSGGCYLGINDTTRFINSASSSSFGFGFQFSPPMSFPAGTQFQSDCATIYGYEGPATGEIEPLRSQSRQAPTPSDCTPNPWISRVTIAYQVAKPGHVTLDVYDEVGRLVVALVDGALGSGAYCATWDGTNEQGIRVSAGTYFYRLRVGGDEVMRQMVKLD